MIKIISTISGEVKEVPSMEPGTWVHLLDPSEQELVLVSEKLGIEKSLLSAPLDDEESARIETEDGATMIIVHIPTIVADGAAFFYDTMPLGVVLTENNVVTVCLEDTAIIEDFWNGRVKTFDSAKKTRFLLQILYLSNTKFLQYLRLIDKSSERLQAALEKSMKNREVVQMMRLSKSLVYFSTSLKANSIVMERILRTPFIKKYPEDEDLLEDVMIETKQAIEMSAIYMEILSNTLDAFASVVSNNQNTVMKLLASVTMVMAIPSIFSGFWGMNFENMPFLNTESGFYIVIGISFAVAAVVALIIGKRKMF